MTQRDPTVALRHMLDNAVEAIEMLGNQSNEQVHQNRMLQLALIRLVEVVGEAANRVPHDIQQQHPDLPWREATSIRNLLIHGYDIVDADILCDTIRNDFPDLVEKLNQILG